MGVRLGGQAAAATRPPLLAAEPPFDLGASLLDGLPHRMVCVLGLRRCAPPLLRAQPAVSSESPPPAQAEGPKGQRGLWSLRRREVAALGASDKALYLTRPSGHGASI